ncbi:hypothetical protein [Thermus sp.]|uniref:hypothetical protein n=1 Tax=Thermus sp. TaxID=275 RepID=UPI0025D44B74|nr:hypothetical protein [Thermus sp.]MCS6867290.1 hypothetical protein [Thermus sp.]
MARAPLDHDPYGEVFRGKAERAPWAATYRRWRARELPPKEAALRAEGEMDPLPL